VGDKVNHVEDYGWNSAQRGGHTQYTTPKFIELLKRHKVKRLLDLGCGNGSLCQDLAHAGFEALGICCQLMLGFSPYGPVAWRAHQILERGNVENAAFRKWLRRECFLGCRPASLSLEELHSAGAKARVKRPNLADRSSIPSVPAD
jgi:hypothetical protein